MIKEFFEKDMQILENLKRQMEPIVDEIYQNLFVGKIECTKEEFSSMTERLEAFNDILFEKINFPLLQTSFHTNWNWRMFDEIGHIRKLRESKPKVEAIQELFSQLSPEERKQLAKKLGGQ